MSIIDTDKIDWTAAGGKLKDFDDGHIPENCKHVGPHTITRIVAYPGQAQDKPSTVHVVDNSCSVALVQALYRTTVQEGKPWGTYVTINEVRDSIRSRQPQSPAGEDSAVSNASCDKQELALQAVATFLKRARSPKVSRRYTGGGAPKDNDDRPLWTEAQLEQAHGVAIWALASDTGSQVPYHMDYAEQVRYESNVICPPALAGVLHCTETPVQGGDYWTHLQGLGHYKTHGYKGCKQKNVAFTKEHIMKKDPDWIRVPYQCNRMILQSGHLPHLSTPVQQLDVGCKRVIVGFNVFLKDVGPAVQRAPEHSDAFRRKVAVSRLLQKRQRLSLKTVQQNPSLAKMLVLAKRQKIKQDLERAQLELDQSVLAILQQEANVTVESLSVGLGRTDGVWPCAVDVEAHVLQRIRKGVFCFQSVDAQDVVVLPESD